MAWLAWFAAFLEQAAAASPLSREAKALAHAYLDLPTRLVIGIVMVGAAHGVRRTAPGLRPVLRTRRHGALNRAIIGARLWRQLHATDLRRRIAALRQPIETMVARVLGRLRCGLSRWGAIPMRPEARRVAATAACAATALAFDSS